MKRVSVLFLLTYSLLFSSNLEEYPFLGVTISTQTTDIASNADLESVSEVAYGFRYGRQTLDWRTMGTIEFANNLYVSYALEIDKILMDNMFGYPEIRPYAGLTVGYVTYKGGEEDVSTYFYGANAGLLVYASDNIDADIGYHYYKIQNFEELDAIQGASLSLHYFY